MDGSQTGSPDSGQDPQDAALDVPRQDEDAPNDAPQQDAAMDACLRVLEEAAPESLHWSVVLDRALKGRLIDPFTTRDVRGTVIKTLATLAKEGRITKDSKGTYRAAAPPAP